MLFVSRQKKVESLASDYCKAVLQALQVFHDGLLSYSQTGDRQKLGQDLNMVHRFESSADDIRTEIEVMMYSKSIFPESRGDILLLLEMIDRVPNQAETAIRMLWTNHITIPEFLQDGIMKLLALTLRSTEVLIEAVEQLFSDFAGTMAIVGKIDEIESEADNIEGSLVERVFSSELDGFQKILLRDFIGSTGAIPDRAENAGDRIRIIVAKRSV